MDFDRFDREAAERSVVIAGNVGSELTRAYIAVSFTMFEAWMQDVSRLPNMWDPWLQLFQTESPA